MYVYFNNYITPPYQKHCSDTLFVNASLTRNSSIMFKVFSLYHSTFEMYVHFSTVRNKPKLRTYSTPQKVRYFGHAQVCGLHLPSGCNFTQKPSVQYTHTYN